MRNETSPHSYLLVAPIGDYGNSSTHINCISLNESLFSQPFLM
jgi:hypothetical protein